MLTTRLLFARCCRRDRWFLHGRCRVPVLSLLLMAMLAVPGALTAQIKQTNEIIRFRLRDGYLIFVQTMVNGVGPFSFLLDTGATHTVIDPGLARQLGASVIGEASLTTVSEVRQDQLVRLKQVRVGGSEVSELGAIVDKLEEVKLKAPGIRGVLGEDFLSNFDFLIDYNARILRFGEEAPSGERCRFETMGHYRGLPTTNRLLIEAEFIDVSGGRVQLQLDTGAKIPELFPVRRDSFPSWPWAGSMAFSSGPNGTTIHSRITIKVGSTTVHDLDVVQSRRGVAFDAVGLLPASIFRRIYISHSGGFVVLNPVE